MNAKTANIKYLSGPEKLPGLSRNRPVSRIYIWILGLSCQPYKETSFFLLNIRKINSLRSMAVLAGRAK